MLQKHLNLNKTLWLLIWGILSTARDFCIFLNLFIFLILNTVQYSFKPRLQLGKVKMLFKTRGSEKVKEGALADFL